MNALPIKSKAEDVCYTNFKLQPLQTTSFLGLHKKYCRENCKYYFYVFQCLMPGKSFAVFFETVKSDKLDRGFITT